MKNELLQDLIEETLHVEYVRGNVVEMTDSFEEPWHSLPSNLISVVTEGSSMLETKGSPPFHVSNGEAIFLPAGTAHHTRMTSSKAVYNWAHFRFTVLGALDVTRFYNFPTFLAGKTGKQLSLINQELTELWQKNEPDIKVATRKLQLGFSMLDILMKQATPKEDIKTLFDEATRIAPVLSYINDHFRSQITCNSLMKQAALSPSRFHEVFKNTTGLSPMKYVTQLRLHHAQVLLLKSSMPIAEVADQVGYADPFHFSRLFKSAFAQSPKAYRTSLCLT